MIYKTIKYKQPRIKHTLFNDNGGNNQSYDDQTDDENEDIIQEEDSHLTPINNNPIVYPKNAPITNIECKNIKSSRANSLRYFKKSVKRKYHVG